ncbi:MFS transporter [Gordonia sp. (in: high G+C Gram-positive bacteria)]|uniref:MFS transporter n=1 Tax=Gordonia sp. (in: high G+C Gram-positive bacteria) TaxID=84139 RepID=UPI003C74EAEC
MTSPVRVSRRVTAGFAAGSVGTGGFGVLPGLVLAYYLTDTLGVAALLASFVVVIPKLVDVIVNPIIGARSDRQSRRSGSRTGLMWIGTTALLPAFILIFSAPANASPWVGAAWVLVFFTIAAVAYACFQVPYIAIPTDLTADYHERTRLIGTRIAVLALTILIIGAGAPALRDAFGGGPLGYAVMATAAALIIAAGMAVATHIAGTAARHAPLAIHDDEEPGSHRDAFDAFRQQRRYRILLSVYVIQALATAVMLAGAQYVATYVLDNKGALTPLFIALVAPALIVTPVWVRIGKAGKTRGLVLASTLFGAAALGLSFAMVTPGAWIFGAVAVAGIGYAGMQTFPLAMLPDLIDERSTAHGRDQGGAMSGLWTAGETLGLALGPGCYLLVLAATGFVSSSGESVAQSSLATAGIAGGFSLLPAALVALSIILLRGYNKEVPA